MMWIIREVLALAERAVTHRFPSLRPLSCAISTPAELLKRLARADLNSSPSPRRTLGRPTLRPAYITCCFCVLRFLPEHEEATSASQLEGRGTMTGFLLSALGPVVIR